MFSALLIRLRTRRSLSPAASRLDAMFRAKPVRTTKLRAVHKTYPDAAKDSPNARPCIPLITLYFFVLLADARGPTCGMERRVMHALRFPQMFGLPTLSPTRFLFSSLIYTGPRRL